MFESWQCGLKLLQLTSLEFLDIILSTFLIYIVLLYFKKKFIKRQFDPKKLSTSDFHFKFKLSQRLSENCRDWLTNSTPQHTDNSLPFPAFTKSFFSFLMVFKRKENLLSPNFSLMLEMLKILTASFCEISHQSRSLKRLWIRQYRLHYSLKLTVRKYHV